MIFSDEDERPSGKFKSIYPLDSETGLPKLDEGLVFTVSERGVAIIRPAETEVGSYSGWSNEYYKVRGTPEDKDTVVAWEVTVTESEKLYRKEVFPFIKRNVKRTWLEVTWYRPEVVAEGADYQWSYGRGVIPIRDINDVKRLADEAYAQTVLTSLYGTYPPKTTDGVPGA